MSKSFFTAGYERFRYLLVSCRQAAELTQSKLAKKLGKPQSFVSKMERGERRLDVVEFEEVVIALGRDPIEMLEAFTRGLTLKIVQEVALMNCGPYVQSQEWKTASRKLHDSVGKVVWPSGTKKFVINGESGKKRGEGNGVKPIKEGLMSQLRQSGWMTEGKAKNSEGQRLGNFDALYQFSFGACVLEWETEMYHRAIDH